MPVPVSYQHHHHHLQQEQEQASQELRDFLRATKETYVQYAEQLHKASYESVTELAAATPQQLVEYAQVPIGPAGAIVKAAAGAAAGGGAAAAAAAGGGGGVPDAQDAPAWVGKMMHDGQAIGTIVRIAEAGLCVTATHCLVRDGVFLAEATAFGGRLTLVGSSPFHDVVFVRGPSGTCCPLQQAPLQIGQAVAMFGYPLVADLALGTKEHPTTLPVVTRGQVVAISPSQDLVAADYANAPPNASGGAVLSAGELAGVHVGTFFHLDTTHKAEEEDEPADESLWGTEPGAMWKGSFRGGQGKRRATGQPAAAAQDITNLVLHAAANIPQKAQLALFVPASVIWRLTRQLKLMGLTDMDVVQRKHSQAQARSQH